jgi:hypothetical protein
MEKCAKDFEMYFFYLSFQWLLLFLQLMTDHLRRLVFDYISNGVLSATQIDLFFLYYADVLTDLLPQLMLQYNFSNDISQLIDSLSTN